MAKIVCFYFKTISQKTCYSYDAYCCNLENCISKCACVIFFRETFRSDYEALRERLTTLPDKTTHDVMVMGFHSKITSMLHIFLKKLTIQELNIIFKVERPDKKRRFQLASTFTFYRLRKT